MTCLKIGVDERRKRLMRRHCLAPETNAASVVDATRSMIVLHATDPATVYLSALVRCPSAALADMSAALYDDATLVKLIGMRRTMFVSPVEFAPTVHSAAGLAIADRLRKQLVKQLETLPTEPSIDAEAAAWLEDLENAVEKVALDRGEALASQLSKAEPRLRTSFIPTTDKKWDVKRNITSQILTLMGAEGRLVRGRPAGTWISRQHTWVPARKLWPGGMPEPPVDESREALARRWLEVFGPATIADIQWWTGWTLGATRKALSGLDVVSVDLDGAEGVVLANDTEPDEPTAPSASLLPALDPTPMGWQQRDWFLGTHRAATFDRNGNIGPTVWWDGRIVGAWGMRDGEVVWRLLEDVGREAEAAVEALAADLTSRIEGVTVVPSFRTPLERELAAS